MAFMDNQEKKKMTRKEREIKLRVQIILEAAEKLFLTKGYENATMDEIASESEFSKGTLYNYFKSKDELYLAIGVKAYNLLADHTISFIEKQSPGLNQLMSVGYAYYSFSKKYPTYANVFHDIAIKVPDILTKPKNELTNIEKQYLNSSNNYRDIFLKVMSDAIKLNAIRSDKSPMMIGYILSTISSSLVRNMMQNEHVITSFGLNRDEIIDFAFEILAEGLKPRELDQNRG
jgi:TetR/AcrR family transcriptional regulator